MAMLTIYFKVPIMVIVLTISVLPMPFFYLYHVLRSQGRISNKRQRCTLARITQIRKDAFALHESWVVTAEWLDSRNNQTLWFQSYPQEVRPNHQIGDYVSVVFDIINPSHYYYLELDQPLPKLMPLANSSQQNSPHMK